MVGTTKQNCEGYTSSEIAAATEFWEGLTIKGNPPTGDYIKMVHSGLIRNFPIIPQEVTDGIWEEASNPQTRYRVPDRH